MDTNTISGLPDDLLVKILLLLPTKVAISTSILSKRWRYVWMWLPKLEYVSRYCPRSTCETLRCFLDRTLPLHRAPVIESFCLHFALPHFKPEDIKPWLASAVSRDPRELMISYINHPEKTSILPSSLYNCKSLVTLELSGDIALDVPSMVCLPSLKTLELQQIRYFNGESLGRLLSICHVLEDLMVDLCDGGSIGMITIIVPSLLSLSLKMPRKSHIDGLEINTPSLKYLKLDAHNNEVHTFSSETMPKLEEAYVDVRLHNIKRLIESIASVKRLTLCSKISYGDSVIFNHLEHLKLCDCRLYSLNLPTRMLNDTPNLRVLDIFKMVDHDKFIEPVFWWNTEDSTVPECLLSSLQTLNWSGYSGRPHEKYVAVYIMKNSRRLKTATISYHGDSSLESKLIKELKCNSRAPTTCQLLFHQEL